MRQGMFRRYTKTTLIILLSVILLFAMLISFNPAQSETPPKNKLRWCGESYLNDQASVFFNDSYIHEIRLYFDDPKNSAYFEKASGAGVRQKYRLRIYNLRDKPVKFERKVRIYNCVFKESEVIEREEAEKI
ncbi:MAG: VTC domain-containing protein [Candidatus Bathyarchaeia archaeon]